MKTLASTEFRKTFASLDEEVTVTVLGHPIATYTPFRGVMHITQRGADNLTGQITALTSKSWAADVDVNVGRLRGRQPALPPPAVGENILREKDEEIARLKRELASRPGIPLEPTGREVDRDASLSGVRARAGRQKVIDEALRKVNRTTKPK